MTEQIYWCEEIEELVVHIKDHRPSNGWVDVQVWGGERIYVARSVQLKPVNDMEVVAYSAR